jgi:hypothetical protein
VSSSWRDAGKGIAALPAPGNVRLGRAKGKNPDFRLRRNNTIDIKEC